MCTWCHQEIQSRVKDGSRLEPGTAAPGSLEIHSIFVCSFKHPFHYFPWFQKMWVHDSLWTLLSIPGPTQRISSSIFSTRFCPRPRGTCRMKWRSFLKKKRDANLRVTVMQLFWLLSELTVEVIGLRSEAHLMHIHWPLLVIDYYCSITFKKRKKKEYWNSLDFCIHMSKKM